jgi:hypothetical protein
MDDEILQNGTIICVNRNMSSVNLIFDVNRKVYSDSTYQHRRFFGLPLRASVVDCKMRKQAHFTDIAIDYLLRTGKSLFQYEIVIFKLKF